MNHPMYKSVAFLVIGLLAGCGSATKDPAGPASALALCQGIGTTLASRVVTCTGGALPEAYMNLELAVMLNCQNFQEGQAAGRIAFDQAKAKACLDTLASTSCGLLLRGGSLLPAACYDAVAPQVAVGGTCTSPLDLECVGGFCDTSAAAACTTGGRCVASATLGQACSSTLKCAPGLTCNGSAVCAAAPTITLVGVGGDCTASTTSCNDGLFCNNAVTPRVCAPFKGAGEACTSASCQAGLRCDPVSSTCVNSVALGGTCVPGQGQCAGNAYCGPASRCVAVPVLGADCTPVTGELAFCLDSWCRPAVAPATAPTCAPYAAPGTACDTGNLLQCGLGHTCVPVTGTAGVCGRNYCGAI